MKSIIFVLSLALVGCANQNQGAMAGAAIGAAVGSVIGRELSDKPQHRHDRYDPYSICYRYLEGYYPDRHAYNHCIQDIRRHRGR